MFCLHRYKVCAQVTTRAFYVDWVTRFEICEKCNKRRAWTPGFSSSYYGQVPKITNYELDWKQAGILPESCLNGIQNR